MENITYERHHHVQRRPGDHVHLLLHEQLGREMPARPSAAPADSTPSAGENIPVYRNIRVSNLTASCQKSAGVILGLPENCISNVVFENVHLSASTGLTIRNARNIQFNNSSVTVKSGSAFTAENARVAGLENSN